MRGKSPRGLDAELYGETNEKDSWAAFPPVRSSRKVTRRTAPQPRRQWRAVRAKNAEKSRAEARPLQPLFGLEPWGAACCAPTTTKIHRQDAGASAHERY